MKQLGRLDFSLYFEDLEPGTTWETEGRTIFEADLCTFLGLAWFNERLFANMHDRSGFGLKGQPVPGALVYIVAEGLTMPSISKSGLAFLHTDMDIKQSVSVGDTVYVKCEVIESRRASEGARGLVRTRNTVVNQHGETVLVYQPLRLIKMRGEPADS